MKAFETYINEKLKITTQEEIDFDIFVEEFRIYAKTVSPKLDLNQFKLNVEYHSTELYVFESLYYDEREDKIYILAHNKYNAKHIKHFNLSSMYMWVNYFVLGLNLPHRKNEETALKQIKEVTLYLRSNIHKV